MTGVQTCALPISQALYAADGVHPSELGSHIAAETIVAVIQKDQEGTR